MLWPCLLWDDCRAVDSVWPPAHRLRARHASTRPVSLGLRDVTTLLEQVSSSSRLSCLRCACAAAMPPRHLSEDVVMRMDRLQKQGSSPKDILRRLRAARARRDEPGPSQTAVYTFVAGKTYVRGRAEVRGRKSRLPAGLVATAMRERVRLIKEADNDWLVTWDGVRAATKRVLQARGPCGARHACRRLTGSLGASGRRRHCVLVRGSAASRGSQSMS